MQEPRLSNRHKVVRARGKNKIHLQQMQILISPANWGFMRIRICCSLIVLSFTRL